MMVGWSGSSVNCKWKDEFLEAGTMLKTLHAECNLAIRNKNAKDDI